MKQGLFWKMLAAGALLVAAVYVGVLARNGRPILDKAQAGGGAIGDIIAFTNDVGNTPRLFLINTSKKIILVYQAAQTGDRGTRLLCGRTYALDEELCSADGGMEIGYEARGYNLIEVSRELAKKNRGR